MKIFFWFFLFISEFLNAQTMQASEQKSIDKWIHAVFNIEVKKTEGISYGTAIFFTNKNDTFLITARHVLFDSLTPNESSLAGHIYLLQNPTTDANDLSGFHIDKRGSLVEKQDAEITDLWGFNLRCHCFAISSPKEDVAIVNINIVPDGGFYFTKTLLKRGYRPININDFDTSLKVKSGKELFCVGFPRESIVSKIEDSTFEHWFGNLISVPMITRGNMLEYLPNNNFFEANVFTYHGFSGGPVVYKNKLLGIISGGQPNFQKTSSNKLYGYLMYHPLFAKSMNILKLLKKYYASTISIK